MSTHAKDNLGIPARELTISAFIRAGELAIPPAIYDPIVKPGRIVTSSGLC